MLRFKSRARALFKRELLLLQVYVTQEKNVLAYASIIPFRAKQSMHENYWLPIALRVLGRRGLN
jgi:hypothetical protein